MKIRTLASAPFEEVIGCFFTAFTGYFVKLPEDKAYWRNRFFTARVDWDLSFGMFNGEELVAFIIHGVDLSGGNLTAYNTGTGVLLDFRGNGFVDILYAHALPLLRQQGIEKCHLEVICENEKAKKVYERIGFSIKRKLRSFSGTLPEKTSEEGLQKWHFSEVFNTGLYMPGHYSRDNSAEAVRMADEKVSTYFLGAEKSPEAYLIIDTGGNIIKIVSRTDNYLKLLTAAGDVAKEVKLKNVDTGRTNLINALEKLHFSNPVNQYEMEMLL